ncbi:MAG: NTP transferase domain-containing protein [Chloroflexi bacterium]|nr:NTP transferase domain-containing protein [Chloroflexota bacterium]
MNAAITVAILAGGRSRRMGSDKSFVLLNERPLIEHVVRQVSALALPTMVIANEPERYQALNLPIFSDVMPNKGALGGLYTALKHSETDYTLCVACDMPFLSPPLLEYLITLRHGWDAVVPITGGQAQGLHAIYHQRCLPPMLRAMQENRLKISDFLNDIPVRFVEEAELRRCDPLLRSFINLNTPQELYQAANKGFRQGNQAL